MPLSFLLKTIEKKRRIYARTPDNWVIKKGRNSHPKGRKTDVKKCGHIARQLNPCFVSDLKRAIKDGLIEYHTYPLHTSSSPSKTQF